MDDETVIYIRMITFISAGVFFFFFRGWGGGRGKTTSSGFFYLLIVRNGHPMRLYLLQTEQYIQISVRRNKNHDAFGFVRSIGDQHPQLVRIWKSAGYRSVPTQCSASKMVEFHMVVKGNQNGLTRIQSKWAGTFKMMRGIIAISAVFLEVRYDLHFFVQRGSEKKKMTTYYFHHRRRNYVSQE